MYVNKWKNRIFMLSHYLPIKDFLGATSDGKESACNVGDLGLIPGLGRSPGEGNGNPLQNSCPENRMYRRAWQVHAAAKNWMQLSN